MIYQLRCLVRVSGALQISSLGAKTRGLVWTLSASGLGRFELWLSSLSSEGEVFFPVVTAVLRFRNSGFGVQDVGL